MNPNLFQEDAYRLGSLCNPDPAVRRQALDHCLECIEIAAPVGSSIVSLWLADGTNYPGQDDLRGRFRRLVDGPRRAVCGPARRSEAPRRVQVLRAGLLRTDLPDWGTAHSSAASSGRRLRCWSIPVITHWHERRADRRAPARGGTARRLPLQQPQVRRRRPDRRLDRPLRAVPDHERDRRRELDPATASTADAIAFMIDQSHNVEGKIDAMIQSVVNIQTAYAKALLVDRKQLRDSAGRRRRPRRAQSSRRCLRDRRPAAPRRICERRRIFRPTRLRRSDRVGSPSDSHANERRPTEGLRCARQDSNLRPAD